MKQIKYRIRQSANDVLWLCKQPLRLYKTLTFRDDLCEEAVKLAVVSIIKNEADYIEEWLDYHLFAGVEKFYLYDNESDDRTKKILEPYIEQKLVEYIFFPGRARQIPAYNDALKRTRKMARYVAFIDADEFLYPCSDSGTVAEKEKQISGTLPGIVDELIRQVPGAGGLAVNWRMFGSSHFLKKPEGGVLQNFLYRAKEDGMGNECIKTIVNPRAVFCFNHVHYPEYLYGRHSVDENGKVVRGWKHPVIRTKKIRINHYFTKSKEEWIQRRSIGKADSGDKNDIRTMEEFYEHDNNDIWDDGMLRVLKAMKENMHCHYEN